MTKIKSLLKRWFVDGMSAMALGLFSSLIVGLILSQLAAIPGLSFLGMFSEAVSYTHLDVYKRQAAGSAGIFGSGGITGDGPIRPSFTGLGPLDVCQSQDVYKRQVTTTVPVIPDKMTLPVESE